MVHGVFWGKFQIICSKFAKRRFCFPTALGNYTQPGESKAPSICVPLEAALAYPGPGNEGVSKSIHTSLCRCVPVEIASLTACGWKPQCRENSCLLRVPAELLPPLHCPHEVAQRCWMHSRVSAWNQPPLLLNYMLHTLYSQ